MESIVFFVGLQNSPPLKNMSLPNKLTTRQLAEYGFKCISENLAKHYRFSNCYRSKCDRCFLWLKQTHEVNGGRFCSKCLPAGEPSLSEQASYVDSDN